MSYSSVRSPGASTQVQYVDRRPSRPSQLRLDAIPQPGEKQPAQCEHIDDHEPSGIRDAPKCEAGELLVRVDVIGLSPLDWTAPALGIGMPQMPFVGGREFLGTAIRAAEGCGVRPGDRVLAISTAADDGRTAAFQEYAVVPVANAVRLPDAEADVRIASVGLPFVTVALALGVCLGVRFKTHIGRGRLDLLALARADGRTSDEGWSEVDEDVPARERPVKGDWILVSGVSTVAAQIAIQLAHMAGLKVIAVQDAARGCAKSRGVRADLVVSRNSAYSAFEELVKTVPRLACAVDFAGPQTARWCQSLLERYALRRSHEAGSARRADGQGGAPCTGRLVCVGEPPSVRSRHVRIHAVPLGLFHEREDVGREITSWLARLIRTRRLLLPEAFDVCDGGRPAVNDGLEQLRSGGRAGGFAVRV